MSINKNWYNQIDLNEIDELELTDDLSKFEKTKKRRYFDDGTFLKHNKKKRSKNRKENINRIV
jgi:hypothetical protein